MYKKGLNNLSGDPAYTLIKADTLFLRIEQYRKYRITSSVTLAICEGSLTYTKKYLPNCVIMYKDSGRVKSFNGCNLTPNTGCEK